MSTVIQLPTLAHPVAPIWISAAANISAITLLVTAAVMALALTAAALFALLIVPAPAIALVVARRAKTLCA